MERDGDAVIVRFPMPMRREVTLSLETLGARRVEVEASLDVEARPFDDDAMHFHAAFLGRLRNDAALRPTDLRLLRCAARGATWASCSTSRTATPSGGAKGITASPSTATTGARTAARAPKTIFTSRGVRPSASPRPSTGSSAPTVRRPRASRRSTAFTCSTRCPSSARSPSTSRPCSGEPPCASPPLALTGATFFYASPGAVIERAALDAASAAPLTLPPDVARDRPGTYVCR